MLTMNKYKPLPRNAGVGMVEVLVALIVLGVGMLGVATLYVTTLQAKSSALSRMQAVNLASDMADRIRSNRNAGTNYAIASIAAAAAPGNSCVDTAGTAAISCTPAEMAAQDLYLWSQQVTGTLTGNVTGSIVVDTTTTPSTYTIRLNWSEPNSGALSYVLKVQI